MWAVQISPHEKDLGLTHRILYSRFRIAFSLAAKHVDFVLLYKSLIDGERRLASLEQRLSNASLGTQHALDRSRQLRFGGRYGYIKSES